MAQHRSILSKSGPNRAPALTKYAQSATNIVASHGVLPLGAMMLAASVNSWSQTATSLPGIKTLPTVVVEEKAEAPEGKDALRATQTSIGKGTQQLRDIPQSITVVTEKLIDDRNLDTMKEALKNTGGISFLAAEGGEEDIRLRGFALQSTGDVFVDGMRDPAFYERDTFSLDRLEVMRGSASMLFGRGSTGGAVNQVNKVPRLIDESQVDLTLGSHQYRRIVGDFNIKTGESAALRINAMSTTADNNGAGSSLEKKGVAATYRWGIGERDEFSVGLYHLDNNNGMNYGMPWIRPTATSPASAQTLLPLAPTAYYGMASDYNDGQATRLTFNHLHRFDSDTELKTQVQKGAYKRDQRAGTVRIVGNTNATPGATNLTNFGPGTVLSRGTQLKIQDMDTLYAQSDFSTKFNALGFKHEMLSGIDFASEKRQVYAARNALQGGVVPVKPNTTVGTPDDGAWIDESVRVLRQTNAFDSVGWGAYIQDLVQVTPHWKVLGGLRYDNLVGDYATFAIPNGAPGPVTTTSYRMKVSEISKRLGLLYQPNDLDSYHMSVANSFNTSGDAYSLSAANQNIPPEQSINFEIGAKLDSANKRFTTRLAVFRSTKLHERNTDPLIPNLITLSGKRHVAGAEIDFTGRLTPQWEVYGSYMWMPVANIDVGAAGAAGQGTRPGLTPVHSGTVWSTYQLTQQWRVGGGINLRGRQATLTNTHTVKSYATADLMAEYKIDERFTVKANLTNLTNKLYADALYTGHYIPGAGRLLQVTLSGKF
ncbi:MAG: TonB-dependent siderophore receptor [Rhodoferax sp.]|nr:TonB-dependent siderophore receptor [Rhodoferax sp.]